MGVFQKGQQIQHCTDPPIPGIPPGSSPGTGTSRAVGTTPSAYSSPSPDGPSNKQGYKHGVWIWGCNGMNGPCLQQGQQNPGAGGAALALLSPSSPIPLTVPKLLCPPHFGYQSSSPDFKALLPFNKVKHVWEWAKSHVHNLKPSIIRCENTSLS